MKKSPEGGQRKASARMPGPRVGIFWVVDGKPLIDSTLLNQAESYGDHLIHPEGHAEVWEQLQNSGIMRTGIEYEEPPRGRVMYNTKTRRFTMLADRCILRRKDLVTKIKKAMHLPKNTKVGGDSHYRCCDCLRERPTEWKSRKANSWRACNF